MDFKVFAFFNLQFQLCQLYLPVLVFWYIMPHKLINCNNVLEILAASLFNIYSVKPGFYICEGTIESDCKIEEVEICVAIETKKTKLIVSFLIK